VSTLLSSLAYTAGGVLAGLATAGGLLHRQHRALAEARHLAHHDDTTGLPNRRAVLAHLTTALRGSRPVGLVLLDLDRFKQINDRYGHVAGNDVLCEVARRLSELPPPVRMVGRLSGDEFVCIVDGATAAARTAAELAWHNVSADPVLIGDDLVDLRASVGYAHLPSARPRDLLHAADEAMYLAKTSRSRVHGPAPHRGTPDPDECRAGPVPTPEIRCRDRRQPADHPRASPPG
jgi:diguanylate cyclase (GGDEF)-like protein